MTGTKSKIRDAQGNLVDGTIVDIEESVERFSELKLADGTVLKAKVNAVQAIRIDGQQDADGNPVYSLKSNTVVVVASSPHSGGDGQRH